MSVSWLISSSDAYVLIEPMIYWRDSLDPLHMKYLSPKNRERFGDLLQTSRRVSSCERYGCSFAISWTPMARRIARSGAFMNWEGALDENAMRVIEKIKSMLDPADLMNSGGAWASRAGRHNGRCNVLRVQV